MKKLDENEVKKHGVSIQGDVVFFATTKTPTGETKSDGVIAEGEVTGHAHRINPKKAFLIFNPASLLLWVKSLDGENVEVEHEEHEKLTLKGDTHVSWGQKEYDWAEGLKRVAD